MHKHIKSVSLDPINSPNVTNIHLSGYISEIPILRNDEFVFSISKVPIISNLLMGENVPLYTCRMCPTFNKNILENIRRNTRILVTGVYSQEILSIGEILYTDREIIVNNLQLI